MKKSDVRAIRHKLGMTQVDFWTPLGVTQSGGSRYESGRKIPKSVMVLIELTYGTDDEAQMLLSQLRKNACKSSMNERSSGISKAE